jgi:hypothetical protein
MVQSLGGRTETTRGFPLRSPSRGILRQSPSSPSPPSLCALLLPEKAPPPPIKRPLSQDMSSSSYVFPKTCLPAHTSPPRHVLLLLPWDMSSSSYSPPPRHVLLLLPGTCLPAHTSPSRHVLLLLPWDMFSCSFPGTCLPAPPQNTNMYPPLSKPELLLSSGKELPKSRQSMIILPPKTFFSLSKKLRLSSQPRQVILRKGFSCFFQTPPPPSHQLLLYPQTCPPATPRHVFCSSLNKFFIQRPVLLLLPSTCPPAHEPKDLSSCSSPQRVLLHPKTCPPAPPLKVSS